MKTILAVLSLGILLPLNVWSLDTESIMLTFSDRTDDGLIVLPDAVVEKVTADHVVVVSTKTGDQIKVPLARAVKNVQLRFRAGKEMDEALAKLQAKGAPSAQLDSWQNSTSHTRGDQLAEARALRRPPTEAERNKTRLKELEAAQRRSEHIADRTAQIIRTRQQAIDFYSDRLSQASTEQEKQRYRNNLENSIRKRDSEIKLVPRNYDKNR